MLVQHLSTFAISFMSTCCFLCHQQWHGDIVDTEEWVYRLQYMFCSIGLAVMPSIPVIYFRTNNACFCFYFFVSYSLQLGNGCILDEVRDIGVVIGIIPSGGWNPPTTYSAVCFSFWEDRVTPLFLNSGYSYGKVEKLFCIYVVCFNCFWKWEEGLTFCNLARANQMAAMNWV